MSVKPYLACISLVLLSACGGDDKKSKDVIPEIPITYSVTGKVIDGYLKSAKVCLDGNDNLICDPNEPSALTDETGTFILQTPNESLLNSSRLVAEANTETTIIHSGKKVKRPFAYVARPKATVVSPFTSMIEDLINKGHDYDSAKHEIETWLNLNVDVDADYIAKASDDNLPAEQRKHYERLHFVAKLSTVAIAHNLDKLLTNTEHTKKDVLQAIYHKLVKNLSATSLEATFFHRNTGFIPAHEFLSKRFLNALLIKPESLSSLISVTQAHERSIAGNLSTPVTGDGIHSLNNFFTEELPILWYESWLYNDSTEVTDFSQEIWSRFGFSPLAQPEPFPYLVLNNGSFTPVANDLFVQQLNEDGSLRFSVKSSVALYATMTPEKLDSNGLSIHSVLADHPDLRGWKLLDDPKAQFSDAAEVYSLTFTKDYDYFIMPQRSHCGGSTEYLHHICNTAKALLPGEDELIHATSFEQLISQTPSNGDLAKLKGVVTKTFGTVKIVAELLPENRMDLYVIEWHAKDNGELEQISNFFGKGVWKRETVDDLDFLSMKLPKHSFNELYPHFNRGQDQYNNFLVLQNEKLRWGMRFKANRPFRPNQYVFNKTGRDEIFEQTDFEKLTSGEPILPKSAPFSACRVGDNFAHSAELNAQNRLQSTQDFDASVRNCKTTNFTFTASNLLGLTLKNYDYEQNLKHQLRFVEEDGNNYSYFIDYSTPAPQQFKLNWQVDDEGKVVLRSEPNASVQLYYELIAVNQAKEYVSTKLFYENETYSPEMDGSKGRIQGLVWEMIIPE
ncbi:hypothetical protein SOPP22_02135 [Shewanella sp. OPT22]|nr:hypothetical protein SOPP22_02135 [Shewanella sp. OPT22]